MCEICGDITELNDLVCNECTRYRTRYPLEEEEYCNNPSCLKKGCVGDCL